MVNNNYKSIHRIKGVTQPPPANEGGHVPPPEAVGGGAQPPLEGPGVARRPPPTATPDGL
jgi:hypothetical protein